MSKTKLTLATIPHQFISTREKVCCTYI